jgi:hypothetical protein
MEKMPVISNEVKNYRKKMAGIKGQIKVDTKVVIEEEKIGHNS